MVRDALAEGFARRRRPRLARACALALVAVGMSVVAARSAAAVPWQDLPTEWRLHVGDQSAWRDPAYDDSRWRRVELTADWQSQGLVGYDGMVWYRASLSLATGPGALALPDRLALYLGTPSYGGYQVFAGGRLIGESAGWRVPIAVTTEEVYPIPAEAITPDGSLVLALRVRRLGWASDQALTGSVVGRVALIGDAVALREHASLIHAREHLGSLFALVLAGLFGAVGIFHLLLFVGRRERHVDLWFGLVALLFGTNALVNSIWIFDLTLRLDWTVRWAAASGHLLAAVAIQFLWALFNRPIPRWLRLYQASQVALGLWTLLWPRLDLVIATGTLRWLWLLPALALIAVRIVIELRRRDPEARILAAGALVVVLIEGYEVVTAVFHLPQATGFPAAQLGFAAFLLAMAIALWRRFDRVHRELGRLKDSLEHRVRERTRELELARDRAEAADRLKGQFLANVSHELRTPLTGILGISDLLLEDDRQEDRRELVVQLGKSAARLEDLIDDLLELTRAETHGIVIEREEIDPRRPIEQSLEGLGEAIAESGLEIETTIAPDVPAVVLADGDRLRRVLAHLVDNAVKFTARGTVRVALAVVCPGPAELELVYTVSDTGSGIPEQALAELFTPFHQLDRSLARAHRGMGLGLATTKRFVEAWGGRVWAESRKDLGSTFSFTVPVLPLDEAGENGRRRGRSGVAGEDGVRANPLEVLVAEDNQVTRDLLRLVLDRLGHRVEVARDGHEVLAALERRPYDVVLMDVQMPGMDGLETSREIRRRFAGSRCPVLIALTASLGPELRAACVESGLDELLTKPIDFDLLREVVAGAPGAVSAHRATGGSGPSAGDAPAGSDPVLDPGRISRLRLLERTAEEPVVETLLDSLLRRLEKEVPLLSERWRKQQWEEVARLAHSLSGSAGNVGAERLAKHFQAIEEAAGAGGCAATERVVDALPAELAELRVAVRGLLAHRADG